MGHPFGTDKLLTNGRKLSAQGCAPLLVTQRKALQKTLLLPGYKSVTVKIELGKVNWSQILAV